MKMEFYYYILFAYLLIAFYIDVRKHIIPNWLTMSGVAAGFLFHGVTSGMGGILFSLLGLLAGGGILLLLYIFKAIGAGDVKLFAGIGAIAGVQFTLYGMMYSIVISGIIGVVLLLIKRQLVSRMIYSVYRFFGSVLSKDFKSLEEFKLYESTRFPFMYAVFPGAILTFYYFL